VDGLLELGLGGEVVGLGDHFCCGDGIK
jgi:hypothetical protein